MARSKRREEELARREQMKKVMKDEDIYGIDVSDSTISRITDKILPVAKEWQSRPLEEIYATDDSLFKMLYLAMMDITRKWTGRCRDWGEIHSQPEIFFGERISY